MTAGKRAAWALGSGKVVAAALESSGGSGGPRGGKVFGRIQIFGQGVGGFGGGGWGTRGGRSRDLGRGFACGWVPSESWPWARPCTWRHSQALGLYSTTLQWHHPSSIQ